MQLLVGVKESLKIDTRWGFIRLLLKTVSLLIGFPFFRWLAENILLHTRSRFSSCATMRQAGIKEPNLRPHNNLSFDIYVVSKLQSIRVILLVYALQSIVFTLFKAKQTNCVVCCVLKATCINVSWRILKVYCVSYGNFHDLVLNHV